MSAVGSPRSFAPMRLLSVAPEEGAAATFIGTVLLADLANFTGLTEALTGQAGPDGGDLVSQELNRALAPAVDAVLGHGGEIVKFSGDGLLCLFEGSDPTANAAHLAAQEIAAASAQGPGGETHRFRTAIVRGPVTLACLGGHRGRVELVAGGPAVERAQRVAAAARPGARATAQDLDQAGIALAFQDGSPADATGFLPEFVRARLDDRESSWLRQFRTLSIVFAAVEGSQDWQATALGVQTIVDGYGGQLLRFSLEGGSLAAEIAFGFAVAAGSTGRREALQGAAALAARFAGMRIGVATGRVLLGPIGSERRRQLTLLGSPVNLAARLMQEAAPGEVLVDEASWPAGGAGLRGQERRAVLKGIGERAFRQLLDVVPPDSADDHFFGRTDELRVLQEALMPASPEDRMRPAVVVAEAGMGKTHLNRRLAAALRERGIELLGASATSVGRETPYSGLRAALAPLCGLQDGGDPEPALRAIAQAKLGDADRAPLLGDALGIALADTASTRVLAGPVRAENIRAALTALLRDRVQHGACALVVDDAHWLDAASWALLRRLAAELQALRIAVFMRPMPPPEPAESEAVAHDEPAEPPELQWFRRQGAALLELAPLAPADIVAVAARHLAVRDVPPTTAQWLVAHADGNPFFAQELAARLVMERQIEVQDGAVSSDASEASLANVKKVDSIESTLEQRILRLGDDDSDTLRVASVIGPTFTLDALAALTPGPRQPGLEAAAGRFVAANMAVAVGAGQFAFRHRKTQDTAYDMLPSPQRRDLHRRLAEWLELRAATRSEDRVGELAHHWYAADQPPKAMHWLELAGIQALRTGADREAATCFERALSLGGREPPDRQASWHRQLARANFGLGNMRAVATHAQHAIERVAWTLPASRGGWVARSARMACGRLLGVGRFARVRTRDDAALLEGARAAGLLAESAYFLNAPEMTLGGALMAVDLTERSAGSAPVSVAYGTLGVLAGMARLHGTARRYLERAREVAQAADDPYQLGVAWFYAGMYHGCIGDWDASQDAARRALALTEQLGAHMQSGFEHTLLAANALYMSEYETTRTAMALVRSRALLSANTQQASWSLTIVAVAELHQGRLAEAIALGEESLRSAVGAHDRVSQVIADGVCCAALARSGRLEAALVAADRASKRLEGAPPSTWGQLEGFSGPCEVYATALARGAATRTQVDPPLRVALSGLRKFGWIFPFGRSRYQWICGLLADAQGNRPAARAHLREAIALARRFRMPFDELCAVESMAAHAGPEQAGLAQRADVLRGLIAAGRPQPQAVVQAV